MYFEKELDGTNMNIQQGIYDVTNTTLFTIAEPIFQTPADNAGGTTLTKYENIKPVKEEKDDLDYSILRYANVFGPGQKMGSESGVIPVFCDLLK